MKRALLISWDSFKVRCLIFILVLLYFIFLSFTSRWLDIAYFKFVSDFIGSDVYFISVLGIFLLNIILLCNWEWDIFSLPIQIPESENSLPAYNLFDIVFFFRLFFFCPSIIWIILSMHPGWLWALPWH